MKIVFDCRYTRIGRHDGISRYTAGVVTELAALHDVTMLISDRRQLEMLPDLPWSLASSPTSVLEPLVARQVNKLAPDVVFSPMQTMGTWGRKYALALTVHDLIYYSNPTPPRDLPAPIRALWRLYHLAWWPQRLLLNRADAIVTVSETTRDLIAKKKLTKRPVVVVRNAADAPTSGDETPTDPSAPRERSKSLVYMGSFMPYKNVETLVRGMTFLPGYELHLMSRISDADRTRLEDLSPSATIVFHNGATDDDYLAAVRSATALVTASRDEGFGIPLVEAMGEGTPVVVSDIPVFREIGGDAALYFPADDHRAFADRVIELEDRELFDDLSARAVEQAATFSWKRSAEVLLELLTGLARRERDR